jgi:hypothetical protein
MVRSRTGEESTLSRLPSRKADFEQKEHKLKVNRLPATTSLAMSQEGRAGFAGAADFEVGDKSFTESLILAQDERWRRA